MSETPPSSPDIGAEILALASPQPEQPPHVPGPSDAAKSIPASPPPAAPQGFVMGEKVHGAHKKLLDAGTHPRDIVHIKWGRWKGCQCLDCKNARGEMRQEVPAQAGSPSPATVALRDLVDEEIAAQILNTPNRLGEIFCRVKKLPKEALEVWDTPTKELEVYGKLGKRISDIYLDLPDFKHKELFLLGIYMGSQFAMRATTTLLILKTTQENKK